MFETSKLPTEQRTVTGNSVSFNTHYALPLDACKVSFSATQAGSGDPSPSNPRAISGVSAITFGANGSATVIDFDGTRYGGYIDVVEKKMVLNRVRVILSDLSWRYNSNNNRYFAMPTLKCKEIINTSDIVPMCDIFNGIKTSPLVDNSIMNGWSGNYRGYLVVYSTSITSLTDFENTISGHEVVYTIQDGDIIEIPLSDIPALSSIIGNNTFSTDAGTLEITFADLQEKSASGTVATFNTALAMPLASCNIAVNAWQEGTGDPSPSNVRAIHGFDKLRIGMVNFNQITRNGNFATGDSWLPFPSYGTFSYANNEGTYTIISVSNDRYQNTFRYGLNMTVGHKYFFTADYYVSKESRALIYNIGNAFIKDRVIQSGWSRIQAIMNATFQTSGNKSCYIGVEFCEDYNYQVGDTYKMKNVMCIDLTQLFGSRIADYLYSLESNQEGAGVAVFRQLFYKDYYDYNVGGTWVSVASVNGDSYPDYAEIQLGQEVYGAEVDIVNGVAHCTHEKSMADIFSYYKYNANVFMITNCPKKNGIDNMIFSCFRKGASIGSLGVGQYIGRSDNNSIYIGVDSSVITTIEEFKNWLTSLSAEICYESRTPFDIQLTPTQIETLIGNNTIFADTGNIDLTYKDLDIAKRGDFRQVFKIPD